MLTNVNKKDFVTTTLISFYHVLLHLICSRNKTKVLKLSKIKVMKQFVITSAILIVLTISGFNVNAKGIVNETESFTISINETADLNSSKIQNWTIEYSEANKHVDIEKHQIKNGEEYIVRNDFFEIRYTNTNKGFGVKKIKRNQSRIDPVITEAVINNTEMIKQSLLNSNKLSEEKALNYIASFVPYLLNENYTHLLN